MLTVVIPTRNRPAFVLRLLRYYADLETRFRIVISDSSTHDRQISTSMLRALSRTGLDINYRIYPSEMPIVEKLLEALRGLDTEYTVLGADDDFFVPAALGDALRFLASNLDYSVFHGDAVSFSVAGESRGTISHTFEYPQRSIERAGAAERLLDGMSEYTTTWYSVHRTGFLVENIKQVAGMTDHYRLFELILFAMDVIQGKAKKAERLYMARQGRSTVAYRDPLKPATVVDLMESPGWDDDFNPIRLVLANQLARQEDIDVQDASKVVQKAFESFLERHRLLVAQRAERASSRPRREYWKMLSRLRHMLDCLPVTQNVSRSMHFVEPREPVPFSLDALLYPSSPHHADFMPIYRAVAGES